MPEENKEQCKIPEDVGLQIEVHGTWLKWITVILGVTGTGLSFNIGSISSKVSEPQLVPADCIEHIIEIENGPIGSLNASCEQESKVLIFRLRRYLDKTREIRDAIK